MQLLYVTDSPLSRLTDAIFLAGPTPRDSEVVSWRPEAVKILGDLGFNGTVVIPEGRDAIFQRDYLHQVEWERLGLLYSRVVLFWVPRCMRSMPALTTNVEFGFCVASRPNAVIYGRPCGAFSTAYLDWMYNHYTGRHPKDTLANALNAARLHV